jgi:outer membrane protein assembly factor BamB
MLTAAALGFAQRRDDAANWPQWRGPDSRAVSSTKNLPLEWSEQENLNWKVAIPGVGFSQPAIWGDRIFVTTAIAQGKEIPEGDSRRPRRQGPGGPPPTIAYKFVLYCLDRDTGKTVWERTARIAIPKEGVNRAKGSYANGTPATDGRHVYAFFGSEGLYCYDMAGNLKWERDFGDMQILYMNGEGSSPVIHDDRVIILWDTTKGSFITAVDKQTGRTLWLTDRKEDRNFTTPIVLEHKGRLLVAANGANRVRAYDFKTGQAVWECGGQTECVIPTLVHGHGMVYATSGCIGQKALQAIRLGWTGDITNTKAVAWSHDVVTPYVPSPLLYGNELYVVDDKGILSCYDARSGKTNYARVRIPGVFAVTASLVAAEGKVYLLSEEGTMGVIKAGPKFEVLATNKIDDRFLASPAIANGTIYLRGQQHLYSISKAAVGRGQPAALKIQEIRGGF